MKEIRAMYNGITLLYIGEEVKAMRNNIALLYIVGKVKIMHNNIEMSRKNNFLLMYCNYSYCLQVKA